MDTNLDIRKRNWLRHGDRGISSDTIFEVLQNYELGVCRWDYETPQDPSDFNRCVKLLDAIPEWRAFLPLVSETHQHWKPIIDHWDELEALLKEEKSRPDGMAPKLYKRLSELNAERWE